MKKYRMNDKSTPIESLNNKTDDSEIVNNILSKYNNLENSDNMEHLNSRMSNIENQFENRDMNKEIYDLNSNNVTYNEHYKKELERTSNLQNRTVNQNEEPYEEEYEEYEIIEIPLWKRILNELRIPFYVLIFILFIFNTTFDKFLINKISLFGNQFNECNTYGILFKSLLVAILSYIFIKFIKLQ